MTLCLKNNIVKIKVLYLIFFFITQSCELSNNAFFSKKKNIYNFCITEINTDIDTIFNSSSCSCSFYDNKVIRIMKIENENTLSARDYLGIKIYSVGQLTNGLKTNLWVTFCENNKVIEQFWIEGKLIWVKKFDKKGNLILFINNGHPSENF